MMVTKPKRNRELISEGLLAQIGTVAASGEPQVPLPAPIVESETQPVKPKAKTKRIKPVTSPEGQPDDGAIDNPYAFMKRINGTLVTHTSPYIFPVLEQYKDVDSVMNFRLPINLRETLEAHCHALAIKPSEWIRNAIKYLLYAEQEAMKKLE
jgi:hypothetical protein